MTLTREQFNDVREFCLTKDTRYPVKAYVFVMEAIKRLYQELLNPDSPFNKINPLAAIFGVDITPEEPDWDEETFDKVYPPVDLPPMRPINIKGEFLSNYLGTFARRRFGPLAYDVLEAWNIHDTIDFGNIVFNLVKLEILKQSKADSIEDFKNVFDFKKEFVNRYKVNIY